MTSTTPQQTPQYLTTDQVADLTGYTRSTFETRRSRDPSWGPPYRKIGRRVLYRLDEVVDWIEAHLVEVPGDDDVDQDDRPTGDDLPPGLPEGLPQPFNKKQYREWKARQDEGGR